METSITPFVVEVLESALSVLVGLLSGAPTHEGMPMQSRKLKLPKVEANNDKNIQFLMSLELKGTSHLDKLQTTT